MSNPITTKPVTEMNEAEIKAAFPGQEMEYYFPDQRIVEQRSPTARYISPVWYAEGDLMWKGVIADNNYSHPIAPGYRFANTTETPDAWWQQTTALRPAQS